MSDTSVMPVPAGAMAAQDTVSTGQASEKWGPCLCEPGSDDCHSTVKVESRTWPGINKPGGVGRVTKRTMVEEQRCGESIMMAYYDVKYILGGSEKKVLETYIQCVGGDGKSARQACPRDLFTVAPPEPPRRTAKASPLGTSRPNRMGDGEKTSKLMETKSSMKLMKSGAPAKMEAEHPACSVAYKPKTLPLSNSRLVNSGAIGDNPVRKRPRDAQKESKMMKAKPSSKIMKSGVPLKKEAKQKLVRGDENDARRQAKVPKVSGCVKSQKPSKVVRPLMSVDSVKKAEKMKRCRFGLLHRINRHQRPDHLRRLLLNFHRGMPIRRTEREPVETKEATAPLPHTRMTMLSRLVREVFSKKSTDKLTVKVLKEEVNRLVPADAGPFKDEEMDSAFQFLENEENKLMVSEGQVYLI